MTDVQSKRRLPMAMQRNQRVVTMFTADELERIDKFRTAQKIPVRSELFRQAVLNLVEKWENPVSA